MDITGANRTVPSSRKPAFLHEQIRAFETRRPLFGRPSPAGAQLTGGGVPSALVASH